MRATRIHIQNILGIEDMEIKPGKLTLIEGKNGTGKTSAIEAILALLEGGHDATLIRRGAEEGRVVIELDDRTEFDARVTVEKTTRTVRHPDLGRLGAPQTYINRLTDALSFRPAAWLLAPPEKRAAWLLEAVPMEIDEATLREAVADAVEIPDAALQGHALDVLGRIRQRVYDERTGVNRAGREKRATAGQLAESLPETDADAEDPAAAIREAEARRGEIGTERARKETEIREAFDTRRGEIYGTAEAKIADLQRQIDALKEQTVAQVDALREKRDADIAALNEPFAAEDTALAREIAALREREREAGRHANTRRVVATMTEEAEALEAASKGLSAVLERLDALKLSLLERLPIAGIEVRDGQIYVEDVPFDRLNRAKQVEIALAVAALRAGDLPLVCVDGLECLDAESFAAFQAWADRGDLQMIATRVSDQAALAVHTAE